MDAELDPCPDLAHGGADQREHAGGIAHRVAGIEHRHQVAARALELVAGRLAPLFRIASGRHRPADARRQPALPHQPPDRKPGRDRAARRMEEDRQLAPAELLQERAQAIVGAGVEGAVGRDPFAAADPAGIGVALGDEEHDRRRQRRRFLGRGRLAGRGGGLAGRRRSGRRRRALGARGRARRQAKGSRDQKEATGRHARSGSTAGFVLRRSLAGRNPRFQYGQSVGRSA